MRVRTKLIPANLVVELAESQARKIQFSEDDWNQIIGHLGWEDKKDDYSVEEIVKDLDFYVRFSLECYFLNFFSDKARVTPVHQKSKVVRLNKALLELSASIGDLDEMTAREIVRQGFDCSLSNLVPTIMQTYRKLSKQKVARLLQDEHLIYKLHFGSKPDKKLMKLLRKYPGLNVLYDFSALQFYLKNLGRSCGNIIGRIKGSNKGRPSRDSFRDLLKKLKFLFDDMNDWEKDESQSTIQHRTLGFVKVVLSVARIKHPPKTLGRLLTSVQHEK